MQKLDRLGWAAGICFVSHGVRIGVRVNDPGILEELPRRLPPGWRPASSDIVDALYSLRVGGSGARPGIRHFNLLYAGPTRMARALDLDEVLQELELSLHATVAASARRRLFVHAGVVGWRGQAIVIPGHTHSGKTTLVAALVRAGATYYSDEYAVLDARGWAHPFARPLSIWGEMGETVERFSSCPVETLGGVAGIKPLPIGLVSLSTYRPGARWRPRVLSPGQGLLGLLENTVPARWRPQAALAVLQQVVSKAPVLRGVRGEAEAMAPDLLKRADG